jgi:hypothetical protein
MVNYHDPVTIARDSGGRTFFWCFRILQPDLLIDRFDSGTRSPLARHGWYIYVSQTAWNSLQAYLTTYS